MINKVTNEFKRKYIYVHISRIFKWLHTDHRGT